jgi:hypothetical protein
MTRRLLVTTAWASTVALVVLAARSLAYGLAAPSPLASTLRHSAGGPRLPVVAAAALGICGAFAVAVVWLAALGVRERAALARAEAPHLSPLRVVAHGLLFALASCFAFAAFESYLHLRAGLGWHGLHCLTGPVHANVLPILGGLSLLAAAVFESGRHVLAWLRRTLRLLLDRAVRAALPGLLVAPRPAPVGAHTAARAARPRAPPVSA